MSDNVFSLKVITPDATLFTGDVVWLKVPGEAGGFGILPFHAPFVSQVRAGSLELLQSNGQKKILDIAGGIFKVENNKALIVAE